MKREDIVALLSERLKLVRTEFGFSQQDMAYILGLSKKTLLEIEKGRNQLSWTASVALVAIFSHSDIIRNGVGDEPLEVIRTMVLSNLDTPREKTLGGRVWWREIISNDSFRVQQNLVSGHFRILDLQNRRWHSSLSRDYVLGKFRELSAKED